MSGKLSRKPSLNIIFNREPSFSALLPPRFQFWLSGGEAATLIVEKKGPPKDPPQAPTCNYLITSFRVGYVADNFFPLRHEKDLSSDGFAYAEVCTNADDENLYILRDSAARKLDFAHVWLFAAMSINRVDEIALERRSAYNRWLLRAKKDHLVDVARWKKARLKWEVAVTVRAAHHGGVRWRQMAADQQILGLSSLQRETRAEPVEWNAATFAKLEEALLEVINNEAVSAHEPAVDNAKHPQRGGADSKRAKRGRPSKRKNSNADAGAPSSSPIGLTADKPVLKKLKGQHSATEEPYVLGPQTHDGLDAGHPDIQHPVKDTKKDNGSAVKVPPSRTSIKTEMPGSPSVIRTQHSPEHPAAVRPPVNTLHTPPQGYPPSVQRQRSAIEYRHGPEPQIHNGLDVGDCSMNASKKDSGSAVRSPLRKNPIETEKPDSPSAVGTKSKDTAAVTASVNATSNPAYGNHSAVHSHDPNRATIMIPPFHSPAAQSSTLGVSTQQTAATSPLRRPAAQSPPRKETTQQTTASIRPLEPIVQVKAVSARIHPTTSQGTDTSLTPTGNKASDYRPHETLPLIPPPIPLSTKPRLPPPTATPTTTSAVDATPNHLACATPPRRVYRSKSSE